MNKYVKIIVIFVTLSGFLFGCSQQNQKLMGLNIKSQFSSDVYTNISSTQELILGLSQGLGEVQYPSNWNNKLKSYNNYLVLPLHNNNTNRTSYCLMQLPPQGNTIFVESCL
jgi:hypothetical protein